MQFSRSCLGRRLSTAWQVEAVIVFANLSSLAVLYGDKKLFEENVRQPFADPSTPHQSPHLPLPSDQHHHSTSVRLPLRCAYARVYPPTLHWASVSEALQVTTKVVVSLVVIVAGALMFSQGDFNCTKARARASSRTRGCVRACALSRSQPRASYRPVCQVGMSGMLMHRMDTYGLWSTPWRLAHTICSQSTH